ncbi:MAG: sigma-54 dependent transcriptional regulator [Alphaproteobacteria bacterium]|nr:sigma-54 dependent transcriptional regulator [Alphaproteobacteria bacterium]
MISSSALIVDDDRTARRMAMGVLRNSLGLACVEAVNGQEALQCLEADLHKEIRLILLDLDMPVMGGMEVLPALVRSYPHIPVIILTGGGGTGEAVQAIKGGASDFLSKPIAADRLAVSARNALKMSLMSREISRLRRREESAATFSDLIGWDGGLAESVKIGKKAALSDLPVLISGETGTGKEIFAGAIHGESSRAGRSFIAVNCGAIPEKLVESTLFGHEKGSFTGAINKSAGKFQEAEGGTLFLDEVGELPMDAQVKLLRALQQKEIEPVGAGKPVRVNVRVISATNRKLEEDVKNGRFREDLYFRLNVLPIDLPPLRLRTQDISLLAQYFIEQFCAAHRAAPKTLSPRALETLQNHSWPGNVRELENTMNRIMALCEENILEPQHFVLRSSAPAIMPAVKNAIIPVQEDGVFKSMDTLEREIIALALAHHGHNMSRTARSLGIAKSTLYAKIGHMTDLKAG